MEFRTEGWWFRTAAQRGCWVLALAGMFMGGAHSVAAQPNTTTKISYYTVGGNSAAALVQQLDARAPSHGGARAFGHIDGRPGYTGRLVQGVSCRVENLTVTAQFKMTLPRLASGTELSNALSGQWKSFETFVRRHEERHRAIWIDALSRAERRIAGLSNSNCARLKADINQVLHEAWQSAEKQHVAFDRAEQKRLERHPLLAEANPSRRDDTASVVRHSGSGAALTGLPGGRSRCGSAVVVSPGDTIARIAGRCGTTVSAMVRANPQINDPSTIHPGQALRVPGA